MDGATRGETPEPTSREQSTRQERGSRERGKIYGGLAEVHSLVEGRRGRRGQTSPGEERGNETGTVDIAHGSVKFCEATSIGLADES